MYKQKRPTGGNRQGVKEWLAHEEQSSLSNCIVPPPGRLVKVYPWRCVFMGLRTNTAVWLPNQQRWQINVQKNGVRRSFTSSKPGRTGQREANAKADAWLDDGNSNTRMRVEAA